MANISSYRDRILDKFRNAFNMQIIPPASKLYALAESIAEEASIVDDRQLAYSSKNSLLYATGFDLDAIGRDIFGVERIRAANHSVTPSMKTIKFYTNNRIPFGEINKNASGLNQDIIIPEGIYIRGVYDGVLFTFRINQQVTLLKSNYEQYVSADMIVGNNEVIPSNVLKEHTFTNYTTSSSNLLLVTNSVSIGSGRAVETDDNYRFRLSNIIKSKVVPSKTGIESVILSTPGISSAFVEPGLQGGGTFGAFIQGVSATTSDEILYQIDKILYDYMPPWCTYKVYKPNYLGLSMDISLNSGTTTIETSTLISMQESISSFVNNFYGTEFHVATLRQYISSLNSYVYNSNIVALRVYTGEGDFRMYYDVDLDVSDPIIYISLSEKLQIEQTLNTPINIYSEVIA